MVYKEGFVTVRLFMMSEIPLKMKECVRLTILRLDFYLFFVRIESSVLRFAR